MIEFYEATGVKSVDTREDDRDRADMAFDRELLAQHLADIEGAAADQPAPRETAPTPQCDGSCGSLFCGAIYGRREAEQAPQGAPIYRDISTDHELAPRGVIVTAPQGAPLPTPEQDAIARDVGCYIDPDYAPQGAPVPSWKYRCPDCQRFWHPGTGSCSMKRCPACEVG